jgi:hypothetical protein
MVHIISKPLSSSELSGTIASQSYFQGVVMSRQSTPENDANGLGTDLNLSPPSLVLS